MAAVTGSSPPARATRAKSAALVVAALAIVVLAATFIARRFRGVDGDVLADKSLSRSDAASPTPGRNEGAGSTAAPPLAIAIPRTAEIVGADIIGVHIIYTLLSGSVARHGETTTLDLRFRFSNDGATDMLIGDGAFRLAIGSNVLVPTSGLLEMVASHSVRQGVIRFQLPAGTREAVLRVRIQAAAAELPLDLSSTGRPAETDRADTGDALSRAILAPLRERASDRHQYSDDQPEPDPVVLRSQRLPASRGRSGDRSCRRSEPGGCIQLRRLGRSRLRCPTVGSNRDSARYRAGIGG